jgi:hypothetical protein
MKPYRLFLLASLVAAGFKAPGQGTVLYDQQSSDESYYLEGGVALGLQPLGQSFTASLSSVGFIRLYMYDGLPGANSAVVAVNLRSDSITGTILGTTASLTLVDGRSGPVDFYFTTPVGVVPGATYYFQPVGQQGGGFGTLQAAYNYAGGTAFISGSAVTASDLWFREGIIIPEPRSGSLVLLAAGVWALIARPFGSMRSTAEP